MNPARVKATMSVENSFAKVEEGIASLYGAASVALHRRGDLFYGFIALFIGSFFGISGSLGLIVGGFVEVGGVVLTVFGRAKSLIDSVQLRKDRTSCTKWQ